MLRIFLVLDWLLPPGPTVTEVWTDQVNALHRGAKIVDELFADAVLCRRTARASSRNR